MIRSLQLGNFKCFPGALKTPESVGKLRPGPRAKVATRARFESAVEWILVSRVLSARRGASWRRAEHRDWGLPSPGSGQALSAELPSTCSRQAGQAVYTRFGRACTRSCRVCSGQLACAHVVPFGQLSYVDGSMDRSSR